MTTANLELGQSAPIGQEFELVVLTDLEFQLTLTTKLPPAPRPQQAAPPPLPMPSSPTKSAKSGSVFSRLLSSPKKRAERERKEREEAEVEDRRRREAAERERKRTSVKPTPWDMMRELVDAKTGSFARAYVSLKSHEAQCFGRPLIVDVPCFNEWALEKDANVVSSVRSKRTNGNRAFGSADGAVRRPPHVVGNLELQLLFVPKPKIAGDDDMPKSMSSAIREMKAAEQVKESFWEGCLSQQGGDCPVRGLYFCNSTHKLICSSTGVAASSGCKVPSSQHIMRQPCSPVQRSTCPKPASLSTIDQHSSPTPTAAILPPERDASRPLPRMMKGTNLSRMVSASALLMERRSTSMPTTSPRRTIG